MADLISLLKQPGVKLSEITAHLDGLAHAERVAQVVSLDKAAQVALWNAAENSRPLTLDYLLPPDAAPFAAFPFESKNSLPLFTRFQKVFYLDRKRNICGYNNQDLSWFTGPGYYMVQMNAKAPAEIQIDYTRHPDEHPDGWPEIKSNMAFPSRFIYGGTKDNLRWVSDDVVIGRAYKMGENPMPNWFVLCRKDPRKA